MDKRKKADLVLLFVTFIWGISYVLLDYGLTFFTPFQFSGIRFTVAFFLAMGIFFRELRKTDKLVIKYSLIRGTLLTLIYITASYGVMYTSITNAGFLIGLNVIFTPIVHFFIRGTKPSKTLLVALFLVVPGMGLMTLDGSFKLAIGDIICLVSAVFCAVEIVTTEVAVQRAGANATLLGALSLGVTGFQMSLLTFIDGKPLPSDVPANLWGVLIFLTLLGTLLPFVVQPVAQKHTTATRVSLIYSLEPVFTAVFAFLIMGEVLLLRNYIGAAMMLSGIIYMELGDKITEKMDSSDIREEA